MLPFVTTRSGKMKLMIPTMRRKKLGAAVKKGGAQAILVTNLPDVRYLCGFTGSSAALIVKGSRVTMFTDGRYTTQASLEVDASQIVIVHDRSISLAACEWAVEQGIVTLAFDSATTTVSTYEALKGALPAKIRKTFFVPSTGLVAGLREVKDEPEQDAMRAAAALGCRLFDQILEHIVPGNTEMDVAMALEYMARLEGAERMSFDSIVAGAARSAMPHAHATLARLPKRGFVVLDFGVVLHGYCSDMTRTVHLGKPRKGDFATYEAVLEAQEAGLAAVRAGVTAESIDQAARGVLERHGLAEWFTHSTGHGVGLEIHEAPRLGKKQDQRLKAGMIVTIEPGVYMPGKFGIRIEDTVLVTDTGCEILTPSTKAWMEL
jgi:Xaa-Pro aminopeptidase